MRLYIRRFLQTIRKHKQPKFIFGSKNLYLKLMTAITFAIFLFLSQMLHSPQEVSAAQPSVILSGVKGDVLVKKGGGLRELPAVDGMELVQGDWLQTGKNGTAKLSYDDGTEATIGSSSSLNIQRLSTSDSFGVSAHSEARVMVSQNGQQSSLKLWSGSIWSKVKSLLNIDDSYEVETPTAVMGVRGTLYLVSVNPENGATQGDVIEGVVGVTQNNEATQSAPIQLVTMGQTLRLVSLDAPLPEHQIIDPKELIRTTQPEILVQLVNDIMERTEELAVLTQEQQQAYGQTGVVDHLKAAIGTSFKVNELASFGKEFVTSLKNTDKFEEVKQVLNENNQSIEQLQSKIDTLKNETEEIRSEVVETAKDAGISEEQINNIGNEATGVPTTPGTGTAPAPQPTPIPTPPSSEGGHHSSGDSSNTTASLGEVIPIVQNTPITFSGGIKLDLGDQNIPNGATVKAEEVILSGSSLPAGAAVAGKVVNFTFSGMTVNEPVSLTLPFNPDVDSGKVGIYYLNGSKWEYQNSIVLGGNVIASVNHFSTYGVLAVDAEVPAEVQSAVYYLDNGDETARIVLEVNNLRGAGIEGLTAEDFAVEFGGDSLIVGQTTIFKDFEDRGNGLYEVTFAPGFEIKETVDVTVKTIRIATDMVVNTAFPATEAYFEPTCRPDKLDANNKLYREFKMMVQGMVVDLSAEEGKSLSVSFEGGKTERLRLDSSPALEFDTSRPLGKYSFFLTKADGMSYRADLIWEMEIPDVVVQPMTNITSSTADLTLTSDESVRVEAVALLEGTPETPPTVRDILNAKNWTDADHPYPYWGIGTWLEPGVSKTLLYDHLRPETNYVVYAAVRDKVGNIYHTTLPFTTLQSLEAPQRATLSNPGTNEVQTITVNFSENPLSSDTLSLQAADDVIEGAKITLIRSGNPSSFNVSTISWSQGKNEAAAAAGQGSGHTLILTLTKPIIFQAGDMIDVVFVNSAVKDFLGRVFNAAERELVMPSAPGYTVNRADVEVQGLPGGVVRLYRSNDNSLYTQPLTLDEVGRGIFTNLVDGEYYLVQSLNSIEGVRGQYFYAGPTSRIISGNISMPNGSRATELSLMINASSGYGNGWTQVVIPKESNSQAYTLNVPANPAGFGYRISYFLNSEETEYLTSAYLGTDEMVPYYNLAGLVDVSSEDRSEVNLSLLNGVHITGTVALPTGTASSDMVVSVNARTNSGDYFDTWTKAIIKKGMPAGTYSLTVPTNNALIPKGYFLSYSYPLANYINRAWYSGTDLMTSYQKNAAQIDVYDEEIKDIDLILLDGQKISGEVALPAGQTAPIDCFIYINAHTDGGTPEDNTDDIWTSTRVLIPQGKSSGEYVLTVPENNSTSGYLVYYHYYYQGQPGYGESRWYSAGAENNQTVNQAQASLVDVSSGNQDNIDFLILGFRTITGKIELPVGMKAPENLVVHVYAKLDPPTGAIEPGSPGYYGYIGKSTVILPKGSSSVPYLLIVPNNGVSSGGYRISYVLNTPLINYIPMGWYAGPDRVTVDTDSLSEPVNVNGGSLRDIDLTILTIGRISGKIYRPLGDATSTPVEVSLHVQSVNNVEDPVDYFSQTVIVILPAGLMSMEYNLIVPLGASYLLSYEAQGYKSGFYAAPNETTPTFFELDSENMEAEGKDITLEIVPIIDVVFQDANLELAVRSALYKPTGIITNLDMAELTYLAAQNKGIQDLSGLEYAENLQILILDMNQITDITPLENLVKLEILIISSNKISEISALEKLTNLHKLLISENNISDISVLENLNLLEELFVGYNPLSDFSVLASLANLQELDIDNCNFNDISVLGNLTKLEFLTMQSNEISNIFPLAGLTKLSTLLLNDNDIVNISVLANLPNLYDLYLDYNKITDISMLANFTSGGLISLKNNSLDITPGSPTMVDIDRLIGRGVRVYYTSPV